jgi:PAS domain S-box-containing protein
MRNTMNAVKVKNRFPRWLIICCILETIILLLCGLWLRDFAEKNYRRHAEEQLLAVADLKVKEIAAWRASRLANGSEAMGSPHLAAGIAEWIKTRDRKNTDAVFARFNVLLRDLDYRDFMLIDSTGHILLSFNGTTGTVDKAILRILKIARRERKPQTCDLHLSAFNKTPAMEIVAPLFLNKKPQRFVAAIVLVIDPEQFLYPLIQSWPIPSRTSETIICRREGDSVLFLNNLRHQPHTALTLSIPMTSQNVPGVMAASGMRGIFNGRDYRGKEVISALEQIPDSPWFMVSKVDNDETFGEMWFITILILALIFGILAASLAVLVVFWQQVQKTDQKKAYEAEIERLALVKHFDYLAKNANDIILLADERYHIKEANDRAQEAYGYTYEEFLKITLHDIVAPSSFAIFEEHCPVLIQQGSCRAEMNHLRKDRSEFPVEISARYFSIESENYIQIIIRDITERKQAEIALRESEERYRLISSAAFNYVYSTRLEDDGNLHLNWVSGAFEDITGYSFEEYVAHGGWRASLHPDDLEQDDRDMEMLQSNRKVITELRTIDKSGRVLWVRVYAYPIWDEQQQRLVGISGAVQDITDRKQAEDLLRESENKFTAAFRDSPIALVVSSVADNKYVDVNDVFTQITGFTRDEAVGHTAAELKIFANHDEREKLVSEVRKEGHVYGKEIRFRIKSGKIIACLISMSIIQRDRRPHFLSSVVDITERKQAEDALKKSEEEFRILAEAMPQIVWATQPDGRNIYFNHLWVDYTGLTLEESYGHGWNKPFHPEDQQRAWDAWQNATKNNATYSLECRLRRADGVYKWWLVRGVPVLDANGNIIKWIGTCTDINELKHAEEELRESEDRFRSLYENATLGLYRTTPEGKILLANPALVNMLGYSRLEGLDLKDIEGGGYASTYERKDFLDRIEKEEVVVGLESAWKNQDGKTIYVRESARAIRDAQGKTLYYDGTVEDITERKLAENALKASEEQFRLISENVADMIVVLDLEGKRVYNSPSYRPILGEPDMLKGTDSFREIHPDDREKIKEIFRETVRTGVGHQIEYRLLGKDNAVHFIESVGSVVRDTAGKITNVIVVSRDVTEKKRLEQQSFRTQRLESIGTLASGVAHDLNNVLGPIVLALEVLKGHVADKTALKMLDTLSISAHRGADIVKQILGFARGMEGERIALQLRHLIKETIKIIGETFPRNITVRADLPKETWAITGDSTQIQQVVLNLCVNARDAMPSGGTLAISVENKIIDESDARIIADAKPGKYVQLTVMDTGSGIPPEVIERMFEPFFTTKERGKGTGLGLSTVYAIVRSHGGFIVVNSEPGKGTIFKVFLPTGDTVMAEKILENRTAIYRGNGETILVVDDEESILEITKQTLEAFNYSVLIAKDGLEALTVYKLHRDRIALVITDMMMPKMDGYQTIHALRTLNPAVKIIGSSGLASDGYAHPGLTETPDEFITKPYKAEKLLETIAKVLKEKSDKTG